MSESTASISQKPYPGILSGRAKHIPGSAGILLPGMEARILHPDGSDAEVNEPGELWLRSRATALGYWDNEKATNETFVDGWLKTGDLFSADADGVLYFQDRAKVCFLGFGVVHELVYDRRDQGETCYFIPGITISIHDT